MDDNLIQMVRHAGGSVFSRSMMFFTNDQLSKFSTLIRADEREQCAKFIEVQRNEIPATGEEFAAAIRAMENGNG